MDQFWLNVRYTLVAAGAALIVNYTKGLVSNETATSLLNPLVDAGIGAVMMVGTYIWGNIVRSNTAMVPKSFGDRPDVPTLSAMTGKPLPPTQ